MTIRKNLAGATLTFPGRVGLTLVLIDLDMGERGSKEYDDTFINSGAESSQASPTQSAGEIGATIAWDPAQAVPLGGDDESIVVTLATGETLPITGHVTSRGSPKATNDGRVTRAIKIKINSPAQWTAGAVPAITSSLTASGTQGVSFSYQITASNGPITSYSATGLPAGLSINTSTGVISGTPTTQATTSVTIGASNANGAGPTSTLSLTVATATLGLVALDSNSNLAKPYYFTADGLVALGGTQWPSPTVSGQSATQEAVFGKRHDGTVGVFVGATLGAAGSYYAKSDGTYLAGWTLVGTDTSRLAIDKYTINSTSDTARYIFDGGLQYKMSTASGPPNISAITKSTNGGDSFAAVGGTVTGMSYNGGVGFLQSDGGNMLLYGLSDSTSTASARVSWDQGTTIAALTMPASAWILGALCWDTASDCLGCHLSPYNAGSFGAMQFYTSPRGTVSWTSRQTFGAGTPGTYADTGWMSLAGAWAFVDIKLTTGGWTSYRTPKDIFAWASWAPSTAYTAGKARINGGNIYVCTVAGTSAGSGGPTGTGASITDGTVTWSYHGPSSAPFQQVHQHGGTGATPSKVRVAADGSFVKIYGGQLYRSTDQGANWTAVGSSFPLAANQIAIV